MNLQGQTLGEITVPVTDSPGYLSPEGFGLDPRDGSFWVPLTNSGLLVHMDSAGQPDKPLLRRICIPTMPRWVLTATSTSRRYFNSDIESLNPTTGGLSYFAYSPFPLDLTWSVAGDLWVGDIDFGAEEFDSSGNLIFRSSILERARRNRRCLETSGTRTSIPPRSTSSPRPATH